MKRILQICLLLAILIPGALSAQNLISSTYKGVRTKAQLQSLFANPLIGFGAKYYKVQYTTPDAHGQLDTASALLVVPSDVTKVYPRLVYQHGTSDCKTCVPSRYGTSGGSEGELGLLMAGMGYIALLPDYVGMGDARGFQTYVHAATEASAALDLIRASNQWLTQNNVYANSQLFITGYSQGGHAAMALHRAIEQDFSNELTVTAAAHLSGPYSISGVMRDQILGQNPYFYPAYVPNTILGYQEVYGNLYNQISDVFKPAYAGFIQQYRNGTLSLSNLNTKLIQTLTTETGASVSRRMFKDSIVNVIETNLNHPLNTALALNDVYKWVPTVPTRIFYCTGDDQVPFMNSVVANDTMLANGCTTLVTTDVLSSANHSACVNPAFTQTILFFAGFQQISVGVNAPATTFEIEIAPNPASDMLWVRGLPAHASITLTNMEGRIMLTKQSNSEAAVLIDVTQWARGVYYVQAISPAGDIKSKKVVLE